MKVLFTMWWRIGLSCLLVVCSVMPSFAATSSSYQLQAAPKHTQSSVSSSYSACAQFVEFGVSGSSSSYSLLPSLNCNVFDLDDGGGRRRPVCGNAVLEHTEQCDDGNLTNGDGCSDLCVLEQPGGGGPDPEPEVPEDPKGAAPLCGNGVREEGEQCDDGNTTSFDGCNSQCKLDIPDPTKVDEEDELPEEIPEVPEVPDEQPEVIFDPEIDTDFPMVLPEYPDYGSASIIAVCGNGIREPNEQCDDGNFRSNDGCSSACFLEVSPREPVEVVPPVKFGIGDAYLTNDANTFFFEELDIDMQNYEVSVFDEEGEVYDLQQKATGDDFFAFQFEDRLEDGFYQLRVQDLEDPEHVEYFVLEVREPEEIPLPVIAKLNGVELFEYFESGLDLVVHERDVLFEGETIAPAKIALYSHELDRVFVTHTDEQLKFAMEYHGFKTGLSEDTFEIVALYDDGKVSREQVFTLEYLSLHGAAKRYTLNMLFYALLTMVFILIGVLGVSLRREHEMGLLVRQQFMLGVHSSSGKYSLAKVLLMMALVIGLLFFSIMNVFALTTTPNLIPYEGILRDASATPINSAQDFRFSFWLDADFTVGVDRDGAGAIPGAAPGFSGYSEVQTVTPDAVGFFQINIGEVAGSIPDFITTTHLYLQVEVKPNGSPDTAYETLDIDGVDNAEDRQALGTLPYARNSDFIDNREIGDSSGDIAILGAGDVFPTTYIPGGTDADTFLIDANGDAPGVTQLSFGDLLNNRILQFDPDGVNVGDGWFQFTDDVDIQGDVTVSGTINGVTIGARDRSLQFQPMYPNTAPTGDGTDNKGKLEVFFVDTDGGGSPDNFNYYRWTTKQASLQDFDIVTRVRLPDDFNGFQATPLNLRYRTTNGILTDNRIDISVEDSTGTVVTGMTGNTGLTSAGTFSTTAVTFGGGTFTAGTEITLYIKVTTRSGFFADVSDLNINYIEL